MRLLLIAVAGAAGALARYGVSGVVQDRSANEFPWGTLAVNVTGSFILALVLTLITERVLHLGDDVRLAISVGFLGAYTTFSTFAYETVQLIEDGTVVLAVLNVGASVAAGLLAIVAGIALARAI